MLGENNFGFLFNDIPVKEWACRPGSEGLELQMKLHELKSGAAESLIRSSLNQDLEIPKVQSGA